MIDLLARVTTVSVETQRIVEAMKKASRKSDFDFPWRYRNDVGIAPDVYWLDY